MSNKWFLDIWGPTLDGFMFPGICYNDKCYNDIVIQNKTDTHRYLEIKFEKTGISCGFSVHDCNKMDYKLELSSKT